MAYNVLFNVTTKDDESLQALSTRVTHLMQQVKELRPDKFDLDQLDQDLTCMSLIRALPPNMENLAQQLLLKDALTKEIIINAFVQHDITTSAGFKAPEAAFHTSGSSSSSPSSSSPTCKFCNRSGHTMDECYKFKRAHEKAKNPWVPSQDRPTKKTSGGQKQQKAHQAAPDAALDSDIVESAGNASILSYSSSDLSLPCSNLDWNTDTGATAHMTPHKHWLRGLKPYVVPIRLADHSLVYSAGVGSVVFKPLIHGKAAQEIEFSRVLYVPALRNNLLAVCT